jgi:hypothetical protein
MKLKTAVRLLDEPADADYVDAKRTGTIEFAINELCERNRAGDFFNALRGPCDYDNAVLAFEKLVAEYAPAATGERRSRNHGAGLSFRQGWRNPGRFNQPRRRTVEGGRAMRHTIEQLERMLAKTVQSSPRLRALYQGRLARLKQVRSKRQERGRELARTNFNKHKTETERKDVTERSET